MSSPRKMQVSSNDIDRGVILWIGLKLAPVLCDWGYEKELTLRQGGLRAGEESGKDTAGA